MRCTLTPSAAASDCDDQRRYARAPPAPLLLGQRQALEAEARLGGLRELRSSHAQVDRDRVVDLRLGRAGPHDELGRQARGARRCDDRAHASTAVRAARPSGRRPPRGAWPHGRVVSDDNARDTTLMGRVVRPVAPGPLAPDASDAALLVPAADDDRGVVAAEAERVRDARRAGRAGRAPRSGT